MHLLLALFLSVIINEGPIIDPNGGHTTVSPHGNHAQLMNGGAEVDKGLGVDPNG